MKKLIFLLGGALMQTLIVSAGEPYKAGDVVSDFSLKNVKGDMVSFA